MLRSVAVQRINRGIGFRASGNALESEIILSLQESQRDFERGKTLPRFLLQEDQTLSLVSATHTVALPTGFLREDNDNPIHFFPATATKPTFLKSVASYRDAVEANTHATADSLAPDEPVAPSVYVIRKSTIDFITTANQNYTLYWNYYKSATLLTADIENEWLANAAEWLIGDAGWRIAMDLGNADAVQKFDAIRTAGRAACFGEVLVQETAGGPLRMGANR